MYFYIACVFLALENIFRGQWFLASLACVLPLYRLLELFALQYFEVGHAPQLSTETREEVSEEYETDSEVSNTNSYSANEPSAPLCPPATLRLSESPGDKHWLLKRFLKKCLKYSNYEKFNDCENLKDIENNVCDDDEWIEVPLHDPPAPHHPFGEFDDSEISVFDEQWDKCHLLDTPSSFTPSSLTPAPSPPRAKPSFRKRLRMLFCCCCKTR